MEKILPKSNGTIWISGTYHNIFSIANILTELGFKILNVVTWAKTNPPPNISCRYFTHSTEFIIWARKSAKITHYYNYSIMKQINSNKQMTDVWQLPAIARWEKSCGKHPTQKPLSVLSRIILAFAYPCSIERIYVFRSTSFIPFPFIHAYHLPTLHTYPSITEKVRRIGKYHIELETELL